MEEAKISLDALVPKNHLVHKIDKILLFDFIYPIVESTYSTIGRPSVDPVILVKLVFIQPVVLVNFNILKNISKFLQNVVVLDLIEHCKPVICFQIYSLAL
ncbi:hypothetical protein O992_01051 [Enterococcus faecium NEF1]|nr:hypothetical protein O992_01051 [Enterococcus faecium NEF1]